jgi:hypothetical protein
MSMKNLKTPSVMVIIQGGSNMTGTNCGLFTHNQSRSYLNHLVYSLISRPLVRWKNAAVANKYRLSNKAVQRFSEKISTTSRLEQKFDCRAMDECQ